MTRVLKSKRIEPKSGEVRSVVVFLHGYGANGDDLLGLAEPLSEHLPDTLFVSPDAPENCTGSPLGFQWFPIPWIDGSSEEESKNGMLCAVQDLNAFLDALMVDEDILPEQLALFGFSQGTMMALHVAPRREDPIAGLLRFQVDYWSQNFSSMRLIAECQLYLCMGIRMKSCRHNQCLREWRDYKRLVSKMFMPIFKKVQGMA